MLYMNAGIKIGIVFNTMRIHLHNEFVNCENSMLLIKIYIGWKHAFFTLSYIRLLKTYLKHLALRLDCYKYTLRQDVNLTNSEHEII